MPCITCSDSGYLNIYPHVYCDCAAGVFHETVDEKWLQIQEGELDIGQCYDDDYSDDDILCYQPSSPVSATRDTSSVGIPVTISEKDKNGTICTSTYYVGVKYEDSYSVADVVCVACNSSGYISTDPIEYCSCLLGLAWSDNHSEADRVLDGLPLDIQYLIGHEEYRKAIESMDVLLDLPFYMHDKYAVEMYPEKYVTLDRCEFN